VPDQVSVPEIVPEVVSLLAETGAAGPTKATNRLVNISMTRKWLRMRFVRAMRCGESDTDLIIG